ncbi:MAG: hypothetical protein U9P38_01550, partial [Campylobacterota bacterium]|nr:hypothetical protein [Campylobacterota bacterium]
MKLPIKISIGVSLVSILFILMLFNNLHNRLTTFKKSSAIEKNQKDLENLKNTTDLILQKAKNTLTIVSIANSERKCLDKKIQHKFEFYLKHIPTITELKYISMDGLELISISNKRLFSKKSSLSYLDKESFKVALKEDFFISNIYFNPDNYEMMIDISRKVIDMQNNKIMGVIIAKISMYSIQEMISDKLIDFDAIALLNLDTEKFLYKSSYAKNIEEDKFLSSTKDISTITHNDENYLMVTSNYNNQQLNMKFFVLTKENNLFKEINKTIKKDIQLLIFIIFISS